MRTYELATCGHCGDDGLKAAQSPCPELPHKHGLCPACATQARLVHEQLRPAGWKPKRGKVSA